MLYFTSNKIKVSLTNAIYSKLDDHVNPELNRKVYVSALENISCYNLKNSSVNINFGIGINQNLWYPK